MKNYTDRFGVQGELPKPKTVREWCVAVLCDCFKNGGEALECYLQYTVVDDRGPNFYRMLPETVLDWELYELVRKKANGLIEDLEKDWLPANAHDLAPDIGLSACTPIEIYLSLAMNSQDSGSNVK